MYITCFLVPYPLFCLIYLWICVLFRRRCCCCCLLSVLHQHKPSEVVNCTWMSASLRNSTCDKVGRRLFNWHMRKEKKCIEKETEKRITVYTYVEHLTHAQCCTHCDVFDLFCASWQWFHDVLPFYNKLCFFLSLIWALNVFTYFIVQLENSLLWISKTIVYFCEMNGQMVERKRKAVEEENVCI